MTVGYMHRAAFARTIALLDRNLDILCDIAMIRQQSVHIWREQSQALKMEKHGDKSTDPWEWFAGLSLLHNMGK
jgi:hypothetical protein